MDALRVVVVADGDLNPRSLAAALDVPPGVRLFVIAADAGALRAEAQGVTPDLVVGDADSLGERDVERLRAQGVALEIAAVDKDESDTQLAVRAALDRGATQIRLVGALGGARVEHAVANLLLLAHPMLEGVDVAILDGPSTLWSIGSAAGPGAAELHGSAGDHVSLFALGGTVEGVVTSGLRYPLHGEALAAGPARGLSNELLATDAGVTTERGRLLVIHTVRSTDRPRGAA